MAHHACIITARQAGGQGHAHTSLAKPLPEEHHRAVEQARRGSRPRPASRLPTQAARQAPRPFNLRHPPVVVAGPAADDLRARFVLRVWIEDLGAEPLLWGCPRIGPVGASQVRATSAQAGRQNSRGQWEPPAHVVKSAFAPPCDLPKSGDCSVPAKTAKGGKIPRREAGCTSAAPGRSKSALPAVARFWYLPYRLATVRMRLPTRGGVDGGWSLLGSGAARLHAAAGLAGLGRL